MKVGLPTKIVHLTIFEALDIKDMVLDRDCS